MSLNGIAIAGYRSFGPNIQRFESFAKINLFIGQNNSGKSNVLRLLCKVGANLPQFAGLTSDSLDKHMPSQASSIIGMPLSFSSNSGELSQVEQHISTCLKTEEKVRLYMDNALKIFQKKREIDSSGPIWFDFDVRGDLLDETWGGAASALTDNEISRLWRGMGNNSGGSRNQHWAPQTLARLTPKLSRFSAYFVPAIRQVGNHGSESDGFSGDGIIERLARLQHPSAEKQQDKAHFEQINHFLQTVTNNPSAKIEIPYEKDTILVHLDGKNLPLEHLGTGIHEVIILASAATVLQDSIICMEEPELHLHPILQKQLVSYLAESTSNQYFISTHSAALMDTKNAEIYHIKLVDNASIVERVSSDREKSSVCEDLGYTPSDLLQSNCVIWVEGPSDRVYLNYWVRKKTDSFTEGIHYTIMFYGGRLASHISGKDPEDFDKELFETFISLRRLNRRGVVMIDSDKAFPQTPLNATKVRLIKEFDQGPGHCWVTKGREIENYIPTDQIEATLQKKNPSAKPIGKYGTYDNVLKIKSRKGKEEQASKTAIASYITENYEPDWKRLELGKEIDKLIDFIADSNPRIIK
ncbi:MAG: ATP-binding protein [Proteobacteria bacterium]|nr:ATP-binding protein [Pseudomonadota bacterium]